MGILIMKAEELRIGNLVLVDGEITIVKGWMIHLIQIEKTSNKKIEPIPLTEEWLIRFGFKKDMVLLTNSDGDNFYLSDFKIEYVHQLQNLYFALTGNELDYEKENPKSDQ